jgi:hypothetical protein
MTGIYSINTPERLFEKLVRSFTTFCDSPSEDGIFEVVFPLYHLREWICPGGFDSYKTKPEKSRTREERLHAQLHAMPEYEVVRGLCNSAKHYSVRDFSNRTDVIQGFRAGLGKAGDSLGVTHFTVDGREIREYIWPVYEVYFAYFRKT